MVTYKKQTIRRKRGMSNRKTKTKYNGGAKPSGRSRRSHRRRRNRGTIRPLTTDEQREVVYELIRMIDDQNDVNDRVDLEFIIGNKHLLQYDPEHFNDFTGKRDKDAVDQIINKLHEYWHGYQPDHFILTDRDNNRLPNSFNRELLEGQSKMMYHPNRVSRLLESRQIDLDDDRFDEDF